MGEVESRARERAKANSKPHGFKASVQKLRGRVNEMRSSYKAGQETRRERQLEENKSRLAELGKREKVVNSQLKVARAERRLAKKRQEIGPAGGGSMSAFNGLLGGLNTVGQAASKMGSGMPDDFGEMARRANNMNAWGEIKKPAPRKRKTSKSGRDIHIHISK